MGFARAIKSSPRLMYQQRALPLLGGSHAQLPIDIEVQYRHHRLPCLTKTYVVLWNTGRAIRESDVDAEDRLRFEVRGDARIVSAQVVKSSNGSNVSVYQRAPGEEAVPITFSELEKGEGAVLEILHTSSERYGLLRGTISGMPDGPIDRGRIRHPFNPLPWQVPTSFKAIGRTVFVLTFGFGALLVLLSAFSSPLMAVFGPHVAPVMSVIEGISDVIYATLALIVLAQARRQFPEELGIPELVE